MATKTNAPNPAQILSELVEVANAVSESSGIDQTVAMKGRSIRKAKTPLSDNLEDLVKAGAVESEVNTVIDQLEIWANLFAPQDNVQWDKALVQQHLTFLEAMAPYNVLNPEELQTLEQVKTTLKEARKGGTGVRAPREEQPVIEGRPTRVITTVGDIQVANQAGNKANSASNLKTASVKFLNDKLEGDKVITTDQAKELMTAIKEVVENGKPEASALGLTFTASEGDSE